MYLFKCAVLCSIIIKSIGNDVWVFIDNKTPYLARAQNLDDPTSGKWSEANP